MRENALGVVMGQLNTRIVIFFVTLLVFVSSGCLSLVPAREMIESLRGEPSERDIDDKVGFNYTFTGVTPEVYYESAEISVDSSVSAIWIYFRAGIPGGDTAEGITGDFRYVHAKLLRQDGSIFWEQHVTNTSTPPVEKYSDDAGEAFLEGEWTLEVEARGYGVEAFVDIQDQFTVLVTLKKSCLQFPFENDCESIT